MRKPRTRELRKDLPLLLSRIADEVEKNVPESGAFRSVRYSFSVCGKYWIKEAYVSVEAKLREGIEAKHITVSCPFPDDASRIMSHYYSKASKEEVLNWLRSEEGCAEILGSILQLDESIRNHD